VDEPLIFERSRPGRRACALPPLDVPERPLEELLPAEAIRREDAALPEVGELDIVRHYTRLSQMNFGIDTHFYPLGSCTMKYNPRRNEAVAADPRLGSLHPYQPDEMVQGFLELLHETGEFLKAITGFPAVSLQPAAGAHGELTSLMLFRAALTERGETERTEVLVPDSAHGTNPASIVLCGFRPVELKSNDRGEVDLDQFRSLLGPRTAALMLTNPNTLGLFDAQVKEIADAMHEEGGYVFLDGANLNAIMGRTRPHDFGVDAMHINLHKTFSTPHGGGGPGAGPIGISEELAPYAPVPRVVRDGDLYRLDDHAPRSIGRVRSFVGSSGVIARAYAYIRTLGAEGIREVSETAVLNANYLLARLREHYDVPYDRLCKHEFVLSADRQAARGVRGLDIAKRLLDLGQHPPTVYFPLIVHEALMIEPTETESKETLDEFADSLIRIADEVATSPELFHEAPTTMPVRRLDEVGAARNPRLCCRD
jgi:glycine dehydrogenase subunit 2